MVFLSSSAYPINFVSLIKLHFGKYWASKFQCVCPNEFHMGTKPLFAELLA